MKNNKGVNLVALVVMMVVMIILASIAIKAGTDAYKNALETKAAEERKQVEYAISDRFGDYQRNSTANPLVGLLIPDENFTSKEATTTYITNKIKNEYGKLIADEETQDLIKKFVSDNFEDEDMEYTRILVYRDLIELGIENTNLNAVYLVNYYSNDVVGPIN